MSWDKRAVCKQEDPELFFPVSYQVQLPQVIAAKKVCARCPILAACHTYVTAHPQDDGIWAGLTPRERRALRAKTLQEATP